MARIAVPDDYPSVIAASPSYQALAAEHDAVLYDSLPGGEDGLVERIDGAEVAVNVRSSTRFTARVFERCPALRMVAIWGTGTDNIDLEAARRAGVLVANTPAVAATSIAEHCLALMLAVARRIPSIDRAIRAGEWPRGKTSQLGGKTLGVIGLGAIGSRFARLGEAIGMRTICWTMHPESKQGFHFVPLDSLLEQSDVVSLHLRLSPESRGFLSRERLARMKSTAILINTSRGAVVDEPALVEALSTGRLAGAGLDVFATEPLPADDPLTQLDNVVLSPHSSGATPEALEAGFAMVASNIRAFLRGHPENVVPY